mmetsp:Transcript_65831/g.183402  ORF Transcript_65831/g.183402 Transcript_65831/m.183402 type:complete len:235 (+) Transcript_65831:139-843(+)
MIFATTMSCNMRRFVQMLRCLHTQATSATASRRKPREPHSSTMSEIRIATAMIPSFAVAVTSSPSMATKLGTSAAAADVPFVTDKDGPPVALSLHGFRPGCRCSFTRSPSTFTKTTSSTEPKSPSKSVCFSVTVSLQVLFTGCCPSLTTALASHPGLGHWRSALPLKPSSASAVSSLRTVGALVGALGIVRTKHVTEATPLNKFPSTGHSSTMGESLPARCRTPVPEKSVGETG